MNILDFLFPKYCINCKKFGDYICANCFTWLSFDTKNICLECGKPSYDGRTHPRCMKKYGINGTFTCISYNSVSKKLIYQFKYKPHLTDLKKLFGELMYESLIQDEVFNKVLRQLPPKADRQDKLIFVPIPLSINRFKSRGYNQAELLSMELTKKFNYPTVNCLTRIKDTKFQAKLNKKSRKENINGAFELDSRYSAKIKNSTVILVDDVLTTGSTFSEATSVLKHSGAREVWAIALSKED